MCHAMQQAPVKCVSEVVKCVGGGGGGLCHDFCEPLITRHRDAWGDTLLFFIYISL